MIHRCDKVVPDLDDRILPANAARNSLNLRMAASVNDTNLGITLVNGMSELVYAIPAGDNKCIGQKEDFESQSVFFALWNYDADTDTNNHGIYRIQGGNIDLVIGGSILNFDEDSDVSIAVIDGKIYWTDNISQPRMCNIAKGIANQYPSPLEEWMITQIKRPPGLPLDLSPTEFTLYNASVDYENVFTVETPTQFSYYYVYDNDEESRLAPWSPVNWYLTNVVLGIPNLEYNAYLNGIDIVKQIVFVFRNGNDGVVYAAKRVNNESPFSGTTTITNISLLARTAVTSDILGADFDSVPLLSVSNEIAQNRLDHGNYVIDYPNWTGLTLVANAVSQGNTDGINVPGLWRTHKPNSYYNVGVELLDEWGRKIGVVSQVQVFIPNYQPWQYGAPVPTPVFNPIPVGTSSYWNRDQQLNNYKIEWTLTGALPTWCKYYRIVSTKALGITQFVRTVVKMSYWYQTEGTDVVLAAYVGLNYQNPANFKNFIFKGYAAELTSGEPLAFATGDNLYINLIGHYAMEQQDWDVLTFGGKEFKIIKQVGTRFYFELNQNIMAFNVLIFNYVIYNWPSYFDVEFVLKSNSISDIYYQGTQVFNAPVGTISATGNLLGDCFLSAGKKTNIGVEGNFWAALQPWPITPYNLRFETYNQYTYIIESIFISQNPTNIYSQIWNSDIGQPNVVNENQRQKRILQGIIFSDPLIQGTQINGLSKFNSVDNRQAPLENGPITALVRTNATQREPGVLLAIGQNGVSSFYYDGIQLTNVDGTSNVSTSDRYLASQRPLVGNYGAKKLRNICVTPLGTVYYWSEGITDWIRYTNAGLEQLGETYQFMNYLRNQLDSSTSVMMTYDQVTDEAIIVGNSANAMVFSERFKTFQGARQYYDTNNIRPERGATLSTRTFFFLEGHIWQMGPSVAATTENSFFGTLRDPSLTLVTNEMPTVAKQWNSIKVLGNRPLTCQMNSGNSELPSVESYIDQDWWINRKGDWDAAIRRDQNSVGGVMNGKIMESRILISTFAWDATDFDKLNYIEVKSNKSIVQ
jgi:hypothetical protein